MDFAETQTFPRTANDFLDSVLRLQPRVAALDCDGTLWSGDAGVTFFDWELEQGNIVRDDFARFMRDRYAAYKRGEVDETTMCGEMVTMHQGVPEAAIMRAATAFFEEFFVSQIFPEMRELIRRLQDAGCEVWAISSSNEWLIRAGMIHLGISDDRILATKAELDNGIISSRLVRVPSGPGKPEALREVVKKDVDAAFGNSRWDSEMLAMVKYPFAVNPNPDLEILAREQGWSIYFPDGTRC
jgi:HAD superfamily phosphoserine phosphatase-like hydrolase